MFTIGEQLEDIHMEYDKYKEQVENNVRPTVPQMAQQYTQTGVLTIDDDNT